MTKAKYKLKGHETFVIREGWVAKGIHAVKENERVFSEHMGDIVEFIEDDNSEE